MSELAEPATWRVLSLDGGGAKGFYTLGVLAELEAMLGAPLCERFDLIYGVSTGAIIAALLGLGHGVADIHALYRDRIGEVMGKRSAAGRSAALAQLATDVFKDARFEDMRLPLGIVATKWAIERPMIFKSRVEQVHGRRESFIPGFGCPVAEAVQASCSAYPFFERRVVTTADGQAVELVDGGFCANNPTLYAIADATAGMKVPHDALRVVSIGVGAYPRPTAKPLSRGWWGKHLLDADLVEKALEINTQSMEELTRILFPAAPVVRINDAFHQAEMNTELLERDAAKLELLRLRGRESFGRQEAPLRRLLA